MKTLESKHQVIRNIIQAEGKSGTKMKTHKQITVTSRLKMRSILSRTWNYGAVSIQSQGERRLGGCMTSLRLTLIYKTILNKNGYLCLKESNQGMQKLPHLANISRDKRSKRPTCAPPILSACRHTDIWVCHVFSLRHLKLIFAENEKVNWLLILHGKAHLFQERRKECTKLLLSWCIYTIKQHILHNQNFCFLVTINKAVEHEKIHIHITQVYTDFIHLAIWSLFFPKAHFSWKPLETRVCLTHIENYVTKMREQAYA